MVNILDHIFSEKIQEQITNLWSIYPNNYRLIDIEVES